MKTVARTFSLALHIPARLDMPLYLRFTFAAYLFTTAAAAATTGYSEKCRPNAGFHRHVLVNPVSLSAVQRWHQTSHKPAFVVKSLKALDFKEMRRSKEFLSLIYDHNGDGSDLKVPLEFEVLRISSGSKKISKQPHFNNDKIGK